MNHPTQTTILMMELSQVWISASMEESGGGMRETVDALKKLSSNRSTGALWALALGIAIAPMMAAQGWAETYTLDSIDFTNNGDKTDIILHTGSIVPVSKVEVTDRKLVLDIDQINTEETIRTNFSSANNISHVIMQPLNEHKIRMIIRGENLGVPSVAFHTSSGLFGASNPNYQGSEPAMDKLSRETATALQDIQNAGTQPAVLGKADHASENPAVDGFLPEDEGPVSLTATGGDTQTQAALPAPTSAKPIPDSAATENTPLTLGTSQSAKATEGAGIFNSFFKPGAVGKVDTWIPYGLLALVLLGTGVFIRHKILNLKKQEPSLEDLIQEQAQGKRVGFQEMANAYRSKHEQPISDVMAERPGSRRANPEDVIGLRSLQHFDEPVSQPMLQPMDSAADAKAQAKKLETLLSAMQAASQPKMPGKPVKTPAPKKQVLNQYLQNQPSQPQPAPRPKSRASAEQAMYHESKQRELKRAQEMQSAVQREAQQSLAQRAPKPGASPAVNPVNRAPAAKKRVQDWQPQSVSATSNPLAGRGGRPQTAASSAPRTGQGPLPGNPEVLSFLRNVADLMEKDGKTEIARSIHKNLSTQNLT
jgi:hypothetical protein